MLWLTALSLNAQDFLQNAVINGSFQMDAQLYQADDALGITDSVIAGRKVGINGFGKITYSYGNFSAGVRYEAFMTPIAGFDSRQEGSGFPNIWASYDNGFVGVTVGDFYDQFGNGLILRTYEEWTLGYDNSLSGMRLVLRPANGLTIKALYGSQRFYWDRYERNSRGIVRGLDAEADLNNLIPSMKEARLRVIVGASGVSKYQRDADPFYNLPQNVAAFAGRINVNYGKFSLMTEYGNKINDPSQMNNYIYKSGNALLGSVAYSQKGFGASLQLKRVDNMSFKSDRTITANALDINFIPPINRTHAYSLTAKYPYATQAGGEMGLQFQLNYKIKKGSVLGGKYGTNIALNFSQVNDIVRNIPSDTTEILVAGTLGYSSPFLKVSDKVFFRDINVDVEHKFNPHWKAIVQYMNLYYDIATLQGHPGEEAVKANIGVADITWNIKPQKSLRFELQGLWTKQDDGNWASAMLEYTIAPSWFFTLADQFNYGNPDNDLQNHYYLVSAGYTRESSRVALSYGRQSEGILCVGGVCRQVPAASGLILTLTTSF